MLAMVRLGQNQANKRLKFSSRMVRGESLSTGCEALQVRCFVFSVRSMTNPVKSKHDLVTACSACVLFMFIIILFMLNIDNFFSTDMFWLAVKISREFCSLVYLWGAVCIRIMDAL